MANLFNKMFGKKRPVQQPNKKTEYAPVPRPKYSFVEQYTIVDPKHVLMDYSLFELCETIPVLCESPAPSGEVFPEGFRMRTDVVMGFLKTLEKMPAEKIADPKMRTLTIVHLSDAHRVVISPNFAEPKSVNFWLIDADKNSKDWVLHVTPEKNRAIIDAVKIHTR